MTFIRRLFWYFRASPKKAKAGYTEEVLYAGWVDTVPPKINTPRR
jgi:hypothetical protein